MVGKKGRSGRKPDPVKLLGTGQPKATSGDSFYLPNTSAFQEDITKAGFNLDSGGVLYSDGEKINEDADNLNYDAANKRLSIGTDTHGRTLDILGSDFDGATIRFKSSEGDDESQSGNIVLRNVDKDADDMLVLNVQSTVNGNNLVQFGTGITSTIQPDSYFFGMPTSSIMFTDAGGGQIGIGDISPDTPDASLHIKSQGADSSILLQAQGGNNANIILREGGEFDNHWDFIASQSIFGVRSQPGGSVPLWIEPAAPTFRVRLSENDGVGINKTPDKGGGLDVSGDIHSDGAVFADLPMDFGTILVNSSGDISVTGLGFAPNKVKFESTAPVDATDTEGAPTANANTEDNFSGIMVGFAKNTSGGTVQQVTSSGAPGNNTNAIRHFASSSKCIGISYADQDGNEIAQIDGTLSSWDSDGFTVNIGTFNSVANISGALVVWTAWR